MVMGDSVLYSAQGDAAVVRVHSTNKALSITTDCNHRYCKADPYLGSLQAVVESFRNLVSVGSTPLAITDGLNFGNPKEPEIMWQIKESIRGISDACNYLNYPVVSGNVSLNNSNGGTSIYPTPIIGGLGFLKDYKKAIGHQLKNGEHLLLIGYTKGHLDCSALAIDVLGNQPKNPPTVDLKTEKTNALFILSLIEKSLITACHDLSEGGLILGLAEMALASKVGLGITIDKLDISPIAYLFGEDQARYIISTKVVNKEAVLEEAKLSSIPISDLGVVAGNNFIIKLPGEVIEIPMAELETTFESSLPKLLSY